MWETPVATLLAVILGGLLTYFTQGRLDERRAEREREREDAAVKDDREREQALAKDELRLATRLLLEELDTIALQHAMLVAERHYPLAMTPDEQRLAFPTEVWETYKQTFARVLSDDQWGALSAFMHSVSRVRTVVLRSKPLSSITPDFVERLREGALIARDTYLWLAGEPAPSVNERGEPS